MSLTHRGYKKYLEYRKKMKIEEKSVFFESHSSTDFAGNMFYIAKEISKNEKYKEFSITVSCKIESIERIRNLITKYGIRAELVIRETDGYYKKLASSKYLFTDVGFWQLFQKREGQVCVGTWHGTPLKVLGYSFWEDSYVVANQKRGFLLSDYLVMPNEYTFEKIYGSYELDGLLSAKVLYSGYPRNSIFFNAGRRKYVRKKFLRGRAKTIIAYMPTWRGLVINVEKEGQASILQRLLLEIDRSLTDDYILWAKLHRLNNAEIDYSEFKHIEPFPSDFETYDALNAADILVTDYSSVMFDFANTGKKIILFCYDKMDYLENRRCYFSIDDLPFPIVENSKDLIREIKNYEKYDKKSLLEYIGEDHFESCKNVVEIVLEGTTGCKCQGYEQSKFKRLIYCQDLKIGDTTDSFFGFLNKCNCKTDYITYMDHLFLKNAYKLLQLRGFNKIPMYMYQGAYAYHTNFERKVGKKIKKSVYKRIPVKRDLITTINNVSQREYSRFYYENEFDEFIRFSGLDIESLEWFCVFDNRKTIYIHMDMLDKYLEDEEYRFFLTMAVSKADEINFANEKVYDELNKHGMVINGKVFIENLY